jgi:hypothetical protein
LQFLHLQKCLAQARPLSRAVVNRTALRPFGFHRFSNPISAVKLQTATTMSVVGGRADEELMRNIKML